LEGGAKTVFGFGEPPARRNFRTVTKRIEWMDAAGKNVAQYLRDKKFVKTSKCRQCGQGLVWGEGGYEFDHRDNNPANNSQKNCYLVCGTCHGRATKTEKRAVRGWLGEVEGYRTIKRKVGYKRPKTRGGNKEQGSWQTRKHWESFAHREEKGHETDTPRKDIIQQEEGYYQAHSSQKSSSQEEDGNQANSSQEGHSQ
jgi:hypothetical protein